MGRTLLTCSGRLATSPLGRPGGERTESCVAFALAGDGLGCGERRNEGSCGRSRCSRGSSARWCATLS
eukprot:6618044-Prymnesium_polylepis.1